MLVFYNDLIILTEGNQFSEACPRQNKSKYNVYLQYGFLILIYDYYKIVFKNIAKIRLIVKAIFVEW